MASTSAVEPSSAMEETPNWLEMPHDIMMMILQRIGAVEILISTQKVCTTWRRICKDPAMWKIIDMNHYFDGEDLGFYGEEPDYDIEELSKQAVHRSCGELIDIRLDFFATDDLLDHISRCSSKLNSLRLSCCPITGCGLNKALKRLPHLETLELSYISICAEDIEVIGRNCPQLKSFKMKTRFMGCDGDVHAIAIANSMPALRRLKLVGSSFDNDDGVRAILNGCPHLESLDLCGCFYLRLDRNLEKLCRESIKDFKFERNNIPQGYGESDTDLSDDAISPPEDDYGNSGGSAVSADDERSYLSGSP